MRKLSLAYAGINHHAQLTTSCLQMFALSSPHSAVDEYCYKHRRLNDSQTHVIRSTVASLLQSPVLETKPQVKVIQGPPGTGKTSTIISLLSILGSLDQVIDPLSDMDSQNVLRTLVCAPTNKAVTELASRLLEFFDLKGKNCVESRESELQTQFAHFYDSLSTAGGSKLSCSPFHLGDIALVGNKERLPVEGTPLDAIYVGSRSQRLVPALSSFDKCRLRILQIVQRGLTTLQMKKFPTEAARCSFLDTIKADLEELSAEMLAGTCAILNDLPANYLCPTTRGILWESVEILQGINKLPLLENLSEQDRKISYEIIANLIDMIKKLSRCLMSVEGSFNPFLHEKRLLDTDVTLEDFLELECVKYARIVFCTVSSGGTRAVKQGAPYGCVIVDEAAQLVEVETCIVSQLGGVRQLLLVGDHKQLPSTVMSKVSGWMIALRCLNMLPKVMIEYVSQSDDRLA